MFQKCMRHLHSYSLCVCVLMALGYDRERCLHDPVKKVRRSLGENRRTERVSQREN